MIQMNRKSRSDQERVWKKNKKRLGEQEGWGRTGCLWKLLSRSLYAPFIRLHFKPVSLYAASCFRNMQLVRPSPHPAPISRRHEPIAPSHPTGSPITPKSTPPRRSKSPEVKDGVNYYLLLPPSTRVLTMHIWDDLLLFQARHSRIHQHIASTPLTPTNCMHFAPCQI